MRFLLATSAAGAIAAVIATPAHAQQTVISTARTTPVITATSGNVQITSAGSVKVTSGTAVTINSNHNVSNAGDIAISNASNANGILANPNLTSNITNTGEIAINETYTATDTDDDGDLDGPLAQGSNRYGIRILGGGTHTGAISNSGNIAIEGNQSAGIAIDSALAGSLSNSGGITVVGNDGYGIRTSDVSGNVSVGSGAAIVAQGQNSVGVMLGGNVGGSLVVQGSITATGYRYTLPPADTSILDANDLLQGGSALVVAGNVAGGILLDRKPDDNSTTDTDEDDDGIADASETTANVTTFGAAPAIRIGSATQDVTIGAVSGGPYGLVIRGTVAGSGTYAGVNGTGMSIGGLGHAVNIAGGMNLSGTVRASSIDADATALHIRSGATSPTILNSGTISALGGGGTGVDLTGIMIDAGANVSSIVNSGVIIGAVTNDEAEAGNASAIVDKSGTVTLIENSGGINAFSPQQRTAIDLRANTSGATVRQLAAAAGQAASQIVGDILLGSGNDTVSILAGSVTGDINFGGGSDVFTLNGAFNGELINTAGVAVNLGSGASLGATNLGTINFASLSTASGATLGVTLGTEGHTLYNVAGTANFATGTNVAVTIDRVGNAAGTYTILDAGTLIGANNLSSSIVTAPFLFNTALTSTPATGEVKLQVAVKSAEELGLNASESAIFGAALGAADADQPVASVFLAAQDEAAVQNTLQQLLPDHAGGAFETISRANRLSGGILGDARPLTQTGTGLWLQQFGWTTKKSVGSTANYNVNGWGANAGFERQVGGLGSLGVTALFAAGKDTKSNNDMVSDHYEAGVYWRGGTGPFRAYARGTVGRVKFDGTRRFSGTVNDVLITREAEGSWKGSLYSALAGVSYEVRAGRFSIRPSASIDYLKLDEKGYTETGGGEAFDLTVLGRDSNETGANAVLTLGYDLRGGEPNSNWLRLELEGGRREVLSGSLGETRASFGDGDVFTLLPEERSSGWRGALRLTGGGAGLSVAAEIGAEEVQGKASVNGRLGINLAF
ncbi:MAG TPA: autotransporter outer membrane beta-barrel domain-containing protein [Sphingomicrobium sp.]|nr:autotransporter outer membrane beta-barrel domain-containing protein [Sphingomicrobium sp.]